MKNLKLLWLLLFIAISKFSFAQTEPPNLKLSIQTDLLAYTTIGGWSSWLSAEYQRHKLSLAYINYPNRFRDIYNETGIKENDRFARLQLSRDFKSTSRFNNFYYGINIEHHWRELEEDNNPNEVLEDTNWQGGLFIGYEWQPWKKKETALNNLSVIPWIGLNFRSNNTLQDRVFENTGSIYSIPAPIMTPLGVNISYTFFKK